MFLKNEISLDYENFVYNAPRILHSSSLKFGFSSPVTNFDFEAKYTFDYSDWNYGMGLSYNN